MRITDTQNESPVPGRWKLSRSILVAILATMASPAPAQKLTVSQLRAMLVAQRAGNKSDSEMAGKAGAVELTEQLTASTAERIKAELLAGPKISQALDLLSDVSAPLDPPAIE